MSFSYGTVKVVKTFDSAGKENGFLMELSTLGRKTQAYLTAIYPGCFKGYHLHRVREANYVCVRGRVKVILYMPVGKREYIMNVGDRMHIPINTPTGLKNEGTEEAWIVNFPDPAYDPLLKDEQVEYDDKTVEEWLAENLWLLGNK